MLALDPRVVDVVWAAVEGHLRPRPPETRPLWAATDLASRPRLIHRHPAPAGHRLLLGRRRPADRGGRDHPAQPVHPIAQGWRVQQPR